jgi:hypothetical protein
MKQETKRKDPHFIDEGMVFELIPGATKEEQEAANQKKREEAKQDKENE